MKIGCWTSMFPFKANCIFFEFNLQQPSNFDKSWMMDWPIYFLHINRHLNNPFQNVKQEIDTWYKKKRPFGRHHGGLPQWETHDIPTSPKKSHLMLSSMSFLLMNGTLSTASHERNHIIVTSRTISTMNVNHTWSNHWHVPNVKSWLRNAPQIIDLPLKQVVD